MYLSLSKILWPKEPNWHWTKQKVVVTYDLSPDFMEWETEANPHPNGLFGRRRCILQAHYRITGISGENWQESPQIFAILCHWTWGEERVGWWRTPTSRNQAWQPQDLPRSGFLGGVWSLKSVCPICLGGCCHFPPPRLNPWGGQFRLRGGLKSQRRGQPWSRAASSAEGWAACWEAWLAAWWWCEWKQTTQFPPCLCFGISLLTVNWMHTGEADKATDLFVKEAVGKQS